MNISKLTESKLRELWCEKNMPRAVIAKMYGVSVDEIKALTKKYNLSYLDGPITRTMDIMAKMYGSEEEFFNSLDIFSNYSIEEISLAITRYCFKDGPIEELHKEKFISNDDIEVINEFCYNKILRFLTLAKNNDKFSLTEIMKKNLD